MQCSISKCKVFKIVEWILYIGLCIVSGWFASGVLYQFFSNKTSFSQYEEKVTQYPVVTIILYPASEVKTEDVCTIKYATNGISDFRALKIGANEFYNENYNKTERVILENFQKFKERKAFRIIPTTPILEKNLPVAEIKVFLNKNFTKYWNG